MVGDLYPGKEIPMIVVSKLYTPDYVYEAEVAGAYSFLPKPVKEEKLLSAISDALKKKRAAPKTPTV